MRTMPCNLRQLERIVRASQRKSPFEPNGERFGGVIEELIQQIAWMGGTSKVQSDQWFRVVVTGEIVIHGKTAEEDREKEFRCDASGQSLVFAYLMAYKKWKAAWEKFTGQKWKDPVFRVVS